MRSARILSAVRGHLARHLRAESVKENSGGANLHLPHSRFKNPAFAL